MKAAPTMTATTLGVYHAALLNVANFEQREAAWKNELEARYIQARFFRTPDAPPPPAYGEPEGNVEVRVLTYQLIWEEWWLSLMPSERAAIHSTLVMIR